MKQGFALILLLLFFAAPSWGETYNSWVANCRSYKDVATWLNDNFHYVPDRSAWNSEKTGRKQLKIKGKEEIFHYRTGCSLDAALFARETLNRINPDYRSKIISLSGDRPPVHYLCGFYVGERLFIMDYWNPQESLNGTHGPFDGLNDYVQKFYLKRQPASAKLIRCSFGLAPVPPPRQR